MNLVERNEMIKKFQEAQLKILQAKGNDYAAGMASQEGNANFQLVAELLEGAPMDELTVWAVYFLKHVCSIVTFIRTRNLESEGLAGRFHDIANYANIGHTLHIEMQDSIMLEEFEDEKFNGRNVPATHDRTSGFF